MTDPSSDDYFQDSFDLNEDDLALLDETEAKFSLTVAQSSARVVGRSVSPPPAKKFKGWISPTNPISPTFSPPRTPAATIEDSLSHTPVDNDGSMDITLEGNSSHWYNGTQGTGKSVQKLSFGGEALNSISQKNSECIMSSQWSITLN